MHLCPACGSRFSNDVRFCPHDGQPTQERSDPVTQSDPLLGRIVDGRYRIERVLGEGGMGVVYLVTHVTLQKRMAMKVLREELAADQDVVQRFIQEAQTSSAIGHPNIIDLSDFGRLPDGAVYFVMEYLEGESLTDRIERSGAMSVAAALQIIEQIASALGAAHSHGVVHRDMKPDNVFLVRRGGRDDFVKVLDFGIAKVGNAPSKLTRTGMVFGTPHYMAPEQAAGQVVDARADIYALGVIMYEMFTGVVPFDAETFMGILTKHMFEAPMPPTARGGPPDMGPLEPLVLRALAKKPETRYPTMEAFLCDLDTVRRGGSVPLTESIAPPGPSRPPSVAAALSASTPAPPISRKWPIVAAVAGVLLLAGGSAVGALYALWHRSEAAAGLESARAFPLSVPAVTAAGPGHRPHPGAVPGQDDTAPRSEANDALQPAPAPPVADTDRPSSSPSLAVVEEERATVRIESSPDRVVVLIDGTMVGHTPVDLPRSVVRNDERILLRHVGYRDRTVTSDELERDGVFRVALERQERPERRSPVVERAPGQPTTMAVVDMSTEDRRAVATEAPSPMRRRGFSEVVDPWE